MAKQGEHLSDDLRQKLSDAKVNANRKDFDLIRLEPYFDYDFGEPATRMPPRSFCEHIRAGGHCEELALAGFDRNLLQFYTAICKNSVSFDKDVFTELYATGMSLNEVSTQMEIPKHFMRFIRRGFGVKRSGASFQKRKATEIQPTQRQMELIAGSLMGDAKRMSPTSVGFGHGDSQKAYLM